MDALKEKTGTLNKKDIHIWSFNISEAETDLSAYQVLLSKAEEERASKYKFSEDRERFLWGRIQLKRLLGAYLDEAPEAIILNYTTDGKPMLEKREHQHIQFNISHSGKLIISGFSTSPIGVDVEEVSRNVEIDRVCRNYFSESERKMVENASEMNKKSIFFDIWTKKEALIKGIGKGLIIPLNNFSVSDPKGFVKWKKEAREAALKWYVQSIDMIPGYKAAFATPNKDFEVSFNSLNE